MGTCGTHWLYKQADDTVAMLAVLSQWMSSLETVATKQLIPV